MVNPLLGAMFLVSGGLANRDLMQGVSCAGPAFPQWIRIGIKKPYRNEKKRNLEISEEVFNMPAVLDCRGC